MAGCQGVNPEEEEKDSSIPPANSYRLLLLEKEIGKLNRTYL